jgi:hypothetical protein
VGKAKIYQFLKKLRDEYGAREAGKLYQKLLAIAFRGAGSVEITERGVQGVDVDVQLPDGRNFTIEVKTTILPAFAYQTKDRAALEQRRRQDGYQPILGVLRIQPFYEWNFARTDDLELGTILIESLRPCRLHDLEIMIEPHFDAAVHEHFQRTLERGQDYLDTILRKCGVRLEHDRPTRARAAPLICPIHVVSKT